MCTFSLNLKLFGSLFHIYLAKSPKRNDTFLFRNVSKITDMTVTLQGSLLLVCTDIVHVHVWHCDWHVQTSDILTGTFCNKWHSDWHILKHVTF